jgi:energy-coupling factor transporter ATP-binding protein EcfA2
VSNFIFEPASKKQELMIKRASDTQIVCIGGAAGSGKSTILNHLPTLVIDDPNTNCVLYRRTNPQLEGGLWPNGRDIYENNMPPNMKPRIRDQKKEIIFPNGAKIKYQQAENTGKAKHDAQGQEVTLYGLDEATQFEWSFIEYLFSRLRSKSRHFSRLVMSCNPNVDHELRKIIAWYIGEDGYPIPERDGKIRYFVMEGGEFVWGNSREELGEKLNIPEERWESKILSFSFVSGTIYD